MDALVEEFKELLQLLTKEETNFAKDGPSRRTKEYISKKLTKAEAIYASIEAVILELDKSPLEPDPCIALEKVNAKTLYDRYTKSLNAVVTEDTSNQGNGSQDENEQARLIERHLQKQNVRFECIRKLIEDVEAKTPQELTMAFCTVKIKAIDEAWNRVQTADEDLEADRSNLPQSYQTRLLDYGTSVERIGLQLQERIDILVAPVQRNSHDEVKLPRVVIPKFQGDYFKWMSFRDLFCTMVKDKRNLSDGQKMQMLKTLVEGEAEALIADLTIADVNFNSAWNRLMERYDNNRVVVYKHLNKLIAQQNAKGDAKSIKKLLDTTDQILLALKNLGRPIESWDDWVILTVTQKLSDDARRDWERRIGDTPALPLWEQLKKFLAEHFRMLEGLETSKRDVSKTPEKTPAAKSPIKAYQATVSPTGCPVCDTDHKIFNCQKFKAMNPNQRWEVAKGKKLCFLCLASHEDKLKCDKEKPCKKCNKNHSTWLHDEKKTSASTTVVSAHGNVYSDQMGAQPTGLLATILVLVQDQMGKTFYMRGLLDAGSQGSMITSKAAAILHQPIHETTMQVKGVGGSHTGRPQLMHLTLKPRFTSDFALNVGCYVMKKLTEPLPNEDLDISAWSHLKGLELADPMFNLKGNIDILLGNDVLTEVMLPKMIKGPKGEPMAQKTVFGWVVSGRYDGAKNESVTCLAATLEKEDDFFDLSSFWELETLSPIREPTLDEEKCDSFYDETVTRTDEGSYMVKIPFKPDELGPSRLGDSRNQCMARFMYLEKKLAKDEKLKQDYCKVMQEYIDMGHMSEVGPRDEKLYYIPHHAVIKPDSLTTKTRVVFDASAKTTTGVSLNDCMFTGGKQQDDLINILIRWRTFPVVFKADIAKMYRMIKIDKADQRYHTIIWRKDPGDPLKEYQLNTVTFGTASAPFLATRTLGHIANGCQSTLPLAADTLKNGFYVDDLIFGCESGEQAVLVKDELNQALESANLTLRKWSSNNEQFLESIPEDLTERSLQAFDDDINTKALGLQWNPRSDKFGFKIDFSWEDEPLTKRRLLSQASKLFDPLGWCAPVILNAKLLMQDVWISEIGWDELVSEAVSNQWIQLRSELVHLSNLEVARWIGFNKTDKVQLHGFCDASEKAYSAVVYTRIIKNNEVTTRIIASKTRVAQIKNKMTLPRMELCGAVLLSQLMTTIKNALKIDDLEMFAWCDSTIALAWLKGEPTRWKTFVANRVAEIQAAEIVNWRHCPSEDNPADCASRGLMPIELLNHQLWWFGPKWLKHAESDWPELKIEETGETDSEQRKVVVNSATVERKELLLGSASWFHTVRVLAYCLRMKNRHLIGSPLSSTELMTVKRALLKQCQQEEFPDELEALRKQKAVSSKSKLLALNPFLDEYGLIRVGGRLQHAIMSYDNKHPIILPRLHTVTRLIVEQMHQDTLHGGPQLMLALLRKKYWIIHGKRAVTEAYQKCVACKRFKAATVQQMMGDLPEERVTLERAFLHTGVDYCGPIEVRSSKLRAARVQKGNIAVFVCLGTRASHLELVSDCSTAAFLAAFDRFTARRGICDTMYSDNGTNFVGAYNRLAQREKEWLHSQNEEIANAVSNKGIEWKFIPPGAPNFGGIWERNVRAVKDHLKRTLKTVRLTFEEYGTVLCQIEACLNSRPLQALTADVENVNALTPGHFLIGDALMALPQPSLLDTVTNRNDRWKHLQLLRAVKDHLKRTLKTVRLTFEEYGTVLCQIEACLNSRPLQALTADVENVNALTPGHFLIGDALMALPQPSLLDTVTNRNDRWKHLQLLQQHFWNRWSREHLNYLQQRQKWKSGSTTVNIGDLVLVKDEQLPPKHWLMGRIQETHPGSDGRVRVVTLRTQNGQLKRPMNKICPLLSNDDLEEESSDSDQNDQDNETEEHEIEEHDLGPDESAGDQVKSVETVKLLKPAGKYNLRPRQPMVMLATIFVMFLMIGGGFGSFTDNLVKTSVFKNNAGIYFEQMGRAQVVKTHWTIYIRVDLLRYRQDIKRLKTIEMGLTELCTNMETSSSRNTCEDTIEVIHHQLKMVEELNSLLEGTGDEPSLQRRRRAAPLNGIGWLQHEVFGVMAADQADEIEQHFQETKKDSLYVLNLIKNQTSILDSTVNLMKLTQKETNRNYDKIDEQLALLKNETNLAKMGMKILSLTMYTMAFVNRVEQVQTGLVDMITDLHQGHVSSHVFSPKQFKEQLRVMRNNLPADSTVPTIAHNDIKLLYKIIRGSVRVTHDYIVLQIKFPLVTSTEFQVWHIIPVPTKHEQGQMVIMPETEYLVMNLQRDNFYTLNQQELLTCLRPLENNFICNMKHPLYTSTSTVSACERSLLNNHEELHPTCHIKIVPEKEFWISLNAKNQWIYGTMKPKILNVVCGTDTQQINLEGSGLLELTPGCEINQAGMTIIAESIKHTTGEFNYYPAINLTDAVMKVKADLTPNIKMINLTIDHDEQLDRLSTQLHDLDSQTTLHQLFHIIQFGGHMGINMLLILMGSGAIWWNRAKLMKMIAIWRPKTDDVELADMTSHNDSSTTHHSSGASQNMNSTTSGHAGGGCPFRT